MSGNVTVCRVLVCGGRHYTAQLKVNTALDWLHKNLRFTTMLEGGATGADRFARTWAQLNGVPAQTFPADWQRLGNSAGFERNRHMLAFGQPELVVAFPGGNGTANMIKLARVAGLEVYLCQ